MIHPTTDKRKTNNPMSNHLVTPPDVRRRNKEKKMQKVLTLGNPSSGEKPIRPIRKGHKKETRDGSHCDPPAVVGPI